MHENKNVCRELYSDTEEVPYLSLAGLFTMPLLLNHMNIFKKQNMYDLMNTPMAPHTSMLLVTHILPESPFKEEKTVGIGDIIVGINNQKVRTIYQLEKMWLKEMDSQKPITLHMRDGSLTSATYDDIKKAEQKILQQYHSEEFIKTKSH